MGRSNSICRSSIMCVVVCFACTSGCHRYNDISANFTDYKQRDNLDALVDSMVFSNGEFWDYDANGRRVFPSDISGLVSRTSVLPLMELEFPPGCVSVAPKGGSFHDENSKTLYG